MKIQAKEIKSWLLSLTISYKALIMSQNLF